jgi:hypothetical protein
MQYIHCTHVEVDKGSGMEMEIPPILAVVEVAVSVPLAVVVAPAAVVPAAVVVSAPVVVPAVVEVSSQPL